MAIQIGKFGMDMALNKQWVIGPQKYKLLRFKKQIFPIKIYKDKRKTYL